MKKRVLSLILIFFLITVVACKTDEENKADKEINDNIIKKNDNLDDFEFEWLSAENNLFESERFNGYRLIKYKGEKLKTINIPGEYRNMPVSRIYIDVFEKNNVTTKIILPNSVIIFSNRGSKRFNPSGSFGKLKELKEIEMSDGGNELLVTRDGVLYYFDALKTKTIAEIPIKRSKNLTIEKNEEFGEYCLEGVTELKNIIIKPNCEFDEIPKLLTYYKREEYSLENIYVSKDKYDYFVELFKINNEELIHLIKRLY